MDVIPRERKGVFVEKKDVKCKEYNNDRGAQNQMILSRHVCDILTSSKKHFI